MTDDGTTSLGAIDKKEEAGLNEVLNRTKEALFSVLFNTNKTATHNTVIHLLGLAIDHLQDLAFPLCFQLLSWQIEIKWLQDILLWVSPAKLVGPSNFVYIVVMSIIGLVICGFIVIGYSLTHNKLKLVWSLKLLRATLTLFTTVLYIPIITFLTNMVVNCANGADPSVCWSSTYVFRTVATIVMAVAFVCIMFIVKATFFDPDPNKDDITGRPHARVELFYLLCRTVLSILSICLGKLGNDVIMSTAAAQWVMSLACLATSLLLALAYFWYVPFYSTRYACLRFVLMNNFLWASICMMYTLIRPRSDAGIFFLVVVPLTSVLSIYVFYHRLTLLQHTSLRAISDPYLMELKARLKLIEQNLLYPKSDFEDANGPVTETKINILGKKGDGNSKTDADKQVLDEINDLYIQAAKLMPKSCMLFLFSGMFQMNQMKNRSQCLAIYSKASGLNPALDESFMIFCRKRMLNEKYSGGETINFIAFEQNLKMARMNEKKATIAVIQFWSELLKKQPSFQTLQRHGATIASTSNAAQTSYMKLLKLSPDAPSVYRMYGIFLINVFNDTKQGQELLDRAEEIENHGDIGPSSNEYNFGGLLSSKSNIDLFSNENGQVTISGELQSLGLIKNANQAFFSMFGFKRSEVIGHKLQLIIPEPFATLHDGFLRTYLETGVKKLLDSSRQVVGLNREGYLFPFDLLAKHMVDARGKQSFVGIIRPVKVSPQTGFIILDGDLRVLHFSFLLGQQFNARPLEKTNGKLDTFLTITSWFPGITSETISEVTAKTGYTATGLETALSSAASFLVKGEEIVLISKVYYICEVRLLSSEQLSMAYPDNPIADDVRGSVACPFRSGQGNDFELRLDRPSSRRNSTVQNPSLGRRDVSRYSATPSMNRRESAILEGRGDENSDTNDSPILNDTASVTIQVGNGRGEYRSDRMETSSVGSSSYNSSKKDQTTNFIKRAVKIKNDLATKRVLRLHLTFFLCYSVLISLAIFQTEDFSFTMNTLNSKIEQVSSHAKATANVMTAISHSRIIDFWRLGGHWANSPLALPLASTQKEILDISQSIRSDANIIHRFSTLPLSLTVYEANDTYAASPLDVLLTTTGIMFDLGNANLSDPTLKDKISFIISNGIPSLAYALNYSSQLVTNEFQDFYQGKPLSTMLKASIGPWLSLIIIFGLRFPLYFQIEVEKERFLKMFYEIPKEVLMGIYQSNYQRLMDAQEDEDDDDADLAIKFEIDKVLELNSGLQAEGSSRAKQISTKAATARARKEAEMGIFARMCSWFSDKHKFALKTFVLFSAAFIYFYATGIVLLIFLVNVGDVANQLFWTAQRPAFLFQSLHMLRKQYTHQANSFFNVPLAPYFDGVVLPAPTEVFDRLEWIENGLIHGSSIMQGRPISEMDSGNVEYYYELVNGCTPGSPVDCQTYLNGLCTQGIYHMLNYHLTRGRALSKLLSNGITFANYTFFESSIASIGNLAYNYTALPLFAVVDYHVDDVHDKTVWFTNFHMIFTIVYVVVLLVLYFTVVRPFIYALDEDLKHTSVLAFMVPAGVFSSVPSFKYWLDHQKHKDHHQESGLTSKLSRRVPPIKDKDDVTTPNANNLTMRESTNKTEKLSVPPPSPNILTSAAMMDD